MSRSAAAQPDIGCLACSANLFLFPGSPFFLPGILAFRVSFEIHKQQLINQQEKHVLLHTESNSGK